MGTQSRPSSLGNLPLRPGGGASRPHRPPRGLLPLKQQPALGLHLLKSLLQRSFAGGFSDPACLKLLVHVLCQEVVEFQAKNRHLGDCLGVCLLCEVSLTFMLKTASYTL